MINTVSIISIDWKMIVSSQRRKIYRFILFDDQVYSNLHKFTVGVRPLFSSSQYFLKVETYLPVTEATIAFHVPRRDHGHRLRTLEVEVQFKGVGPRYWPPNVAGRERICYWNHINIRLVVFGLEHTDIMHHGVGTFQLINNGLVVEENVFQRAWNRFNWSSSILKSRVLGGWGEVMYRLNV